MAEKYISPEIKIAAVEYSLSGKESLNKTAAKFGVNRSTLGKWLLNYELFGTEGLYHRTGNQSYPEEMKRRAVEDYLSGGMSEKQICKKYRLRSRTQLERWILRYNGQKELHPWGRSREGTHYMTRVSEEEKMKVAGYCISHNRDYSLTAEHLGVTYQQVYSWTKRYYPPGGSSESKLAKKLSRLITENKQLKVDSMEFEMELAIHQKLWKHLRDSSIKPDFSGVRQAAKFQTVKELNQERGWPIGKLCAAVGVSRAGYYKWCNRTASRKQTEDEKLAGIISEVYEKQHGIPGYRQMALILERQYGSKNNLKRVYRLMCILGLRSVCRRKSSRRKKKTLDEYTAENLLNREFSADKQNEKWLTDVTEFKYGSSGKAYLSAILDLHGKIVPAFSLSRTNNTALVLKTLEQALEKQPGAKPMLHSDRGSQYTSHAFHKKLKQAGICHSMSRPGKCLDNAPMEGFWGILKTEMYYPNHFDDYDSLYKAICNYIDFYNNRRYQRNLGGMTPAEFVGDTA